jgi:hypothetical protein
VAGKERRDTKQKRKIEKEQIITSTEISVVKGILAIGLIGKPII